MFTEIAQWSYSKAIQQEHFWFTEGVSPFADCTLAGAVLGKDIIRIRLLRGVESRQTRHRLQRAKPDIFRYQLVDDKEGTLPYHSWSVIQGDEQWPSLSDTEARVLLDPYLQGFSVSPTAIRLTCPLANKTNEYIYGLGERTSDMNKRGQAFPIWNIDPHKGHNAQTQTMYTSIPFYLGLSVTTGKAYGIFIDHNGRTDIDMGKTNEAEAHITVEGDSLVIYFFDGPTPADVMRQYTDLTGRMPLPPRWALGHHQCRWSYVSEEQVRDIATRMRERKHPCDAIWLDIDYMDGYRNFTWNPATFPNPQQLTNDLQEQGLHLVTILDPGTKIDENYAVYRQGIEHDYFCRYQTNDASGNGDLFKGNVWPGECVFPDFSRTEVRAWWGTLYKELVKQGVDGIWNDMDEPALTNITMQEEPFTSVPIATKSNTMANDVIHRASDDQPMGPDGWPTLHKFFHNAYGMEMARSTFEGLSKLRPNKRPFVLTRSGTAGVQRYAALWTGDNTSQWEDIPMAIPMCLNIGMSGVAFVGVDIGGFWGESTGELLVRFAQLGALLPFCRNHNAVGTHAQEPWAFGEPYESAYRTAIETRYQLLPYLYTLFQEAATNGSPIMRPLYYHYPQDQQACHVEDAFLLGNALLSAPIYTPGANSRNVYLPRGSWFDYWTGAKYEGGAFTTIAAPLERWPLLVKANSIIPSGPVMQYVDQFPTNTLTITCYMAEDSEAHYTLYEDDGTRDKEGHFTQTSISCYTGNGAAIVEIEKSSDGESHPRRDWYELVVHVGEKTKRRTVRAKQKKIFVRL